MIYLLSNDGVTIDQYPLTFRQFQLICRSAIPPLMLDETEWDNGGYSGVNGAWAIIETLKPPYDETEQICKEATPIIVDGAWTQQWEVIDKTDEQKRQEKYNPGGFLNELLADTSFRTWLDTLPFGLRSDLTAIALSAKADNDWTVLQSNFNNIKAGFPMADAVRGELQAIAIDNGVPFTF